MRLLRFLWCSRQCGIRRDGSSQAQACRCDRGPRYFYSKRESMRQPRCLFLTFIVTLALTLILTLTLTLTLTLDLGRAL